MPINVCHYSGEDFIKMFVVSTISTKIANGEPAYTKGKSGIEVLIDIVYETTGKYIPIIPEARFSRSPEYWIGWAIAIINGTPAENSGRFLGQLALPI